VVAGGRRLLRAVLAAGGILSLSCAGSPGPAPSPSPSRPSVLLVTLDTTRADSIGPEAAGVQTPGFSGLAARGRRFRQAQATAPETLPSHVSLMTGLYPAGHGVHENARPFPGAHPVLAERLRQAGYRTAAFVSAFVLARRFGLARGFDVYDDDLPAGAAERTAKATTDRALAALADGGGRPLFLWVHYFEPHAPYAPPEPFRTRYANAPYLGEVAAMDEQVARLVDAFEKQAAGPRAIVVVADHGEGLGDHGEAQHGNLLYRSTMNVPLVIAGPGIAPGALSDTPVSTRRVFHTILDWAGLDAKDSLRGPDTGEVVLGEAMKPFLSYGWQPQVMALDGYHKAIAAGRVEAYDVAADPAEARDLGEAATLSRPLRDALREYPVPSLGAAAAAAAKAPEALGEEDRRKLAALGYVTGGAAPVVRKDAPRPVDMAPLFALQEEVSGLFVAGEYAAALPLLERILAADPHNLDAALRLATAHSSLGHAGQAAAAFERAGRIAPESPDVRVYLGLHYARGPSWERAVPLLELALSETPDRLPVLEALARIRSRQGRAADAVALLERTYALRTPTAGELVQLGQMAMSVQATDAAIRSFEKARELQGREFRHDLELGVLFLAASRLADAREALDRVPASHREYPMALFKRAQVSVLLKEPDWRRRVELALHHADGSTRPLIARERLFGGAPLP
jgi:choline-sulfatase